MLRAKFVQTQLPLELKELSSRMNRNQFNEEIGKGFVISSSNLNRLTGQYIEKFSQTSLVTDPFGNTTEVNSIAYFVCKFNWVFGSSLLTLIEPPPVRLKNLSMHFMTLQGSALLYLKQL